MHGYSNFFGSVVHLRFQISNESTAADFLRYLLLLTLSSLHHRHVAIWWQKYESKYKKQNAVTFVVRMHNVVCIHG